MYSSNDKVIMKDGIFSQLDRNYVNMFTSLVRISENRSIFYAYLDLCSFLSFWGIVVFLCYSLVSSTLQMSFDFSQEAVSDWRCILDT